VGTVLALALVVAIALSVGVCRQHAPEPSVVHIAANLPITGPLAIWGSSIREGATFALEDLTKSGESVQLRVDWQDNASDASTAVTVLQQQLLRSPDIYVSGIKPQVMAIRDQVSHRGLPNIVWVFDADINEASPGNNLRTLVSYKLEAPVYLEYARRRGAKRVAVVYVELPHTLDEFQRLVIPPLRSSGVDVLEERYDLERQDFRDIAARIQAFRPDLVILNGFQMHLAALLRGLRPLGLIEEGNTIGTYDMIDAAKVLGPDELEGVRAIAPVFETRPREGRAAEWRRRFQSRFNSEPLYIHAFAYDMMLVIHDAARRLDLPASSAAWLAALRATNTEGVTGPLRFDDNGDLLTPIEVGVFRGGQLLPDTAPNSLADSAPRPTAR